MDGLLHFSRWTAEFLIHHCMDDTLLEQLLRALPFGEYDSRMKRLILCRKIKSSLCKGVASWKIMDVMEVIQDLDAADQKGPSARMGEAYCALGVDCVANSLQMRNSRRYSDILDKMWSKRIKKLGRIDPCGCVDDKTLTWVMNAKNGVWPVNSKSEYIRAVKNYLVEAYEEIGPSFIDRVAKHVTKMEEEGKSSSEILVYLIKEEQRIMKGGQSSSNDEAEGKQGFEGDKSDVTSTKPCEEAIVDEGEGKQGFEGDKSDVTCTEPCKEANVDEVEATQEVDKSKVTCTEPREEANAEVINIEEAFEDVNNSCNNMAPSLSSSPVETLDKQLSRGMESSVAGKACKASFFDIHDAEYRSYIMPQLLSSFAELRTHVPESTRVAEQGKIALKKDLNADFLSTLVDLDASAGVSLPEASNLNIDTIVDGMSNIIHLDDSPPNPVSLHSQTRSTPRRSSVRNFRFVNRRRPVKWTDEEVLALKKGVKKFGAGKWQNIKIYYSDLFKGRRGGDLKDKWRNLVRTNKCGFAERSGRGTGAGCVDSSQ